MIPHRNTPPPGCNPAEPSRHGRAETLGAALTAALLLPAMAAPVALHVLVATGKGLLVATALACAQLLLGAVLLWREHASRRRGPITEVVDRRWIWLLGLGILATIGVIARTRLDNGLLLVSGVSHAVVFGGLCLAFAASLRRECGDAVTALARRIDPGWTPAMAGYTRGVTRAWAAFFGAQVAASAVLVVTAPLELWSLFVNVLDLPLVVMMFLGEYVVRRRRFPRQRHIGPLRIALAMRRAAQR